MTDEVNKINVNLASQKAIKCWRYFIPLLVIFLGIIILMAVTNPKKSDYVSWVREQSTVETAKFHDKASSELSSPKEVENSTLTNNYVLFSIFASETDTFKSQVVGILNNFLVLSSTEKNKAAFSKPKNVIEMPNDTTLSNLLPDGGGWVVKQKKMVDFAEGFKYIIVGASRKNYDSSVEGNMTAQIFVLRYNESSKNAPWVVIWLSPVVETFLMSEEEVVFKSLNTIETPSIALAVADFNLGGPKGPSQVMAITIDSSGDVRLQKDIDLGMGSVELKNNCIEIVGEEDVGKHELRIENGKFVDKQTPRSKMINPEAVKLYFLLGSSGVVPASNPNMILKVGSTVTFVPQDEVTSKAFDSGEIQIFSDAWNGPPLVVCEANRIKTENSYTFTQTGIANFGLYSYQEENYNLENPKPTFTITVIP
ncbi:MAG: hypothetical protein CVV03_10640 [Firmicutes bacterium HGW-Firmicutes-8]|nr:MAG: hypothetical protein CVV03_10640 [Firmicutes bacterium HGW-Firmicutes-8]